MLKLFIRTSFIAAISYALFACSFGGEDEIIVEDFTVSFTSQSIAVETDESQTISYSLDLDGNFDVSVTLENSPTIGDLEFNPLTSQITFSSNTEVSGSFSVIFRSQSLEISKEIVYSVVEPEEDIPPVIENDQDYIIFLPSDYITIFEDETVTINLKRNYEINDLIVEEFYFNSDNITGELSDDKSQLFITAETGVEDTYGELTAVTSVNGILHESKMYIVYYNKNRDLTTTEAPIIALLDHEIQLTPYSTHTRSFDIYDPDSDRISYRIISAPSYVETHINKATTGYDLIIYTVDDIDTTDNDIVLEVSDAHNTDVHTFNLIEDTDSQANSENNRPDIILEENVTVSLISQFQGDETGRIAELAFAVNDLDDDTVTLSAISASGSYEFQFVSPYLYVNADDISDLQYDQVTIIADDGQFASRFTYHFYIQDNFLTFLGGNPNTAPMSDLPTELDLLETQTYNISFISTDNEGHPFDVGIEQTSAFVETTLTDSVLTLVASEPEVTTSTSIIIWLEDIFGSRREHQIDITINKNTAPIIESDTTEISEVEQTEVDIPLTISDPDQTDVTIAIDFDNAFITATYLDDVLTVNSLDLSEDYSGQITVSATDDFNEVTEYVINVNYQFLDPNNQFPVISITETEFELLPGESNQTSVTITDPEDDSLVISSTKDGDDLTYEYNMDTGIVTFTVDDNAAYEQAFTITISASDGLSLSQENITITVPNSPAAPELTVDFYDPDQPENVTFQDITFTASDINEEEITMSVNSVDTGFDVEIVTEDSDSGIEGYLIITPPENVTSITTMSFNLVASDSSGLIDSELITINIQPVNDAPIIEYIDLNGITGEVGEEIILINDTPVELIYAIEDPDTATHEVDVIYPFSTTYGIESFVTISSNSIRINGSSKEDTFNLISNNGAITITDGDSVEQTLTVNVYEEDDDLGTLSDRMDVIFTVQFANNAPAFSDSFIGRTEIYENLTRNFNISISDADNEDICFTITENSDHFSLWDTRTTPSTEIVSGTEFCSDDDASLLNGELTQMEIRTSNVDQTELGQSFTINASDGFESITKQVFVDVLNP